MTDAQTLTTFRAAQRVMADVTGMTIVHGVTAATSGDGAHAKLRPQVELLEQWPAIVLGSGPIDITPGPITRLTWTIFGGVWRPRTGDGIASGYDALVTDIGAVLTAVLARGKAYSIQAGLQSLRLMNFGAIDGIQWPANPAGAWYLVLPFELQVVADYDTPIVPA